MTALVKNVIWSLLVVFVLGVAVPVYAQVDADVDSFAESFNIVKGRDLKGTIQGVINWFLSFLGMVAVVVIIYGGMQYILSQGDEGKAETGKRTVLFAIIGLAIVGISAVIVNSILNVINRV